MLDLVPFAGARLKMANFQLQVQSVCQTLQGHFPQTATVTVAAAAVSGDHQFARTRTTLVAHVLVPTANAVGRKVSGVMIDPDADPAFVVGHIINPVRN